MLGARLSCLGVGVGVAAVCGVGYARTTQNPLQRTIATSRDIYTFRKEYGKKPLNESELPASPMKLFDSWLDEAITAKINEPNAMCLSTCTGSEPSARFVLLKEVDERGFVWCTNYGSRKAEEIAKNPKAALTFWWGELERQVRIEGNVEKIAPEQSDLYFRFRPKGSKIGAMISQQSQPILRRDELEERDRRLNVSLLGNMTAPPDPEAAGDPGQTDYDVTALPNIVNPQEEYATAASIPRPEGWGGFRLIPTRVEFWKGRENRIHDRICYVREGTPAYEKLRDDCVAAYGREGEELLRSRLRDGWTFMRLQP